MENKEKSEILFGLHYGLIKPLEKQEGSYKYELTEKGNKFLMLASIYLAIDLLRMLFTRVKK